VGLLGLLFALLLPAPGANAAPIGGYQTQGSGQAVSAFPTLPGFTIVQAPFEGTIALTSVNLQAGGQAFARASMLWPGDVLAGLGSLLGVAAAPPVPIPNWPIRAEAHEYTGPSSDSSIPGIRMQAFGSSARADALADVGAVILPAVASIASSSSYTQSLQGSDKASTTVDVSLHGISLGGGVVTVDAFKATTSTVSDGVKPTGKGTAVVTGLSIGGTPATIDATGVHANGQGTPGVDPNAQIATVLAATGIKLALTPSDVHIQGGAAEASAPALIATVPIPAAGPIPAGYLTLVLGATHARAAASAGFDVSDVADLTGSPVGAVQGDSFTSGGDSGAGLPDLSAGGGSGAFSPTPTVSSPRSGQTLNAAVAGTTAPSGYHFGGVSSRLVLVILLLGIVGVRLVRRYMRRLLSLGGNP
jgi:hypothetical protein